MAYTPNANRSVRNGKAMVSADELADFKSKFGADKTLRDLLNMDKGLERKGNREQAATKAAEVRAADDARAATREAMAEQGRRAMEENYAPRRAPKPLTEVRKPGTNVNYENEEAMKKGGKVKGWGKARGARAAKYY